MTDEGAPEDRGCLVAIIFFILGLGTLLPWNFFMTASLTAATGNYLKYFNDRLNTSEWINGTEYARKEYYFNNWMTLLSQLPLLLFTLLNSFLYSRVSEAVRIAGSLVCILILFILTAVLVKVDMDQDQFFSVTMATIWFINSFGAVVQGSLFGLVGLLPQKYSAVFMSGQGLAGTFAAVAMILAIASKADEKTAALGYFITPCVGTMVTLMSYLLLSKLPFAQYYLSKDKSMRYEPETTSHLLSKDDTVTATENGIPNRYLVANGSVDITITPSSSSSQQDFNKSDSLGLSDKLSVIEVFKKIWVMAFCVTFVFTVTLSVFPAVTVDVKTVYEEYEWESYFTPVCCFLLFNLMDWLGRTLTSLKRWPSKESRLFPALVVARVVFIPLLMLCNVHKRSHLPVLFSNDMIFSAIMLVFSLSSGYCVCLSMSYAPQLVPPQDGETAGALMTFFLALGLSIGAALSFPLRLLV